MCPRSLLHAERPPAARHASAKPQRSARGLACCCVRCCRTRSRGFHEVQASFLVSKHICAAEGVTALLAGGPQQTPGQRARHRVGISADTRAIACHPQTVILCDCCTAHMGRTRHRAHVPGGASFFFRLQWILLTSFASVWPMCSSSSRCTRRQADIRQPTTVRMHACT